MREQELNPDGLRQKAMSNINLVYNSTNKHLTNVIET